MAQGYEAVLDLLKVVANLITGPIEKGASEGQATYATDLVKALKAGIKSRTRAGTTSSRPKIKGKRRKNDVEPTRRTAREERAVEPSAEKRNDGWGVFEPVRRILEPAVDIVKPFVSAKTVVGLLVLLQLATWLRGSPTTPSPRVSFPQMLTPERIAAYEEIWRREESTVWDWLEERIGMEGLIYPTSASSPDDESDRAAVRNARNQRERSWRDRDIHAKLEGQRLSEGEIEDAIRVTEKKLEALKAAAQKKRLKQSMVCEQSTH